MSIPAGPPHHPRPGIGDHLKSVDIVAEPIEGWRAWNVRSEGQLLWSWGIRSNYWLKGVNHAECKAPHYAYSASVPPHASPDMNCRCGFWAFKNPKKLALAIGSESQIKTYAWGKIKLWGKIIEGTHGFRGKYAKIEEVTLVNAKGRDLLLDRIASFYEVPVIFGGHPIEPRPLTWGEALSEAFGKSNPPNH